MTCIIRNKKTVPVIELKKVKNSPLQSIIGLKTWYLEDLYLEVMQIPKDMFQALNFDLDAQIIFIPRHKQNVSSLVSKTILMAMGPDKFDSVIYVVAKLLDIGNMTICKSGVMCS